MNRLITIAGGLAGACTVNLLHQVIRYTAPKVAPRMDLLGMEAMRKGRRILHLPVPPDNKLYKQTMIGDIVANTIYYSLAGGEATRFKGKTLGLAAGIGAVRLPKRLGLTPAHSNRTTATRYLAVGMYLAGGVVAAAIMKGLQKLTRKKH